MGQVGKKLFGPGFISDIPVVKLIAKDEEMVLRRRGGDPFYDEILDTLVDITIQRRGYRKGTYLSLQTEK